MSAGLDVRGLDDAALAALYNAGDDEDRAQVLAEAERQDAEAERERRRREWRASPAGQRYAAVEAEWRDAAHADYLAAEAETRGNLLSPAGLAQQRDAYPMLWVCSEAQFARWASWEMREWRDAHAFPNLAEYRRQASRPRAGEMPWHDQEAEAVQAPAPADAQAVSADATEADSPTARIAAQTARFEGQVARDRAAKATRCRHSYRWRVEGIPADACQDCPMLAAEAKVAARRGAAVAVRAPGDVEDQAAAVLTRTAGPLVLVQRPRIDGAHVLDQVHGFLQHFAIWPSDASLIAATGFLAQCHARHPKTRIPVGPYAPHWLLIGEAGSGKTWLGRIMSKLAPNGQLLVEATKASFVQALYERATVVIDESDVLFGAGQRHVAMRALLNAAYEQDQFTTYMQGRERVKVPLTSSVILAGLPKLRTSTGNHLKPLLSRCLITDVVRAPEGYRPPRFDSQARAVAQLLNTRLAAWMGQQVEDGIGDEVPEVPAGLGNRPAALWEPLLTAADRAGGLWPEAMRNACVRLESATGLPGDDDVASGRIDQWLGQFAEADFAAAG